ncbi:MAG TPA: hypothetical protein VHE34_05930 [Puia sp.]|uniref:hypothetical protein n=1 Tax=Puia sp. TaxID=2045100 RepID=UPI002D01D42D|nr:hypothetical protein [Puia sp.]HVU94741.1 hypothetical protein [Puia sp.]
MSSKFAIVGVVSVFGAGVAMHHARFCPLHEMMVALHHRDAKAVVVKAPPAVAAKAKPVTAVVAMK